MTRRVSCSLAMSKKMTSVGKRELIRSSKSLTRLSSMRALKSSEKFFPCTLLFCSAYPRFLANELLPDPKNPDTQTPMASLGSAGVSAMAVSS